MFQHQVTLGLPANDQEGTGEGNRLHDDTALQHLKTVAVPRHSTPLGLLSHHHTITNTIFIHTLLTGITGTYFFLLYLFYRWKMQNLFLFAPILFHRCLQRFHALSAMWLTVLHCSEMVNYHHYYFSLPALIISFLKFSSWPTLRDKVSVYPAQHTALFLRLRCNASVRSWRYTATKSLTYYMKELK